MPALPSTLCNFPLFDFGLPAFSFPPTLAIPAIPSFTIDIDLFCPLD